MTHRCPASIRKGRWRDLWSDCLARLDEPTTADARLLERLVRNLIHADAALTAAGEEPYVLGSQGQRVEHPGYKVAARCDGQALSLARQLRLTPLARSSGNSSAPEEDTQEEDPIAQARDELAERRARTS